MLPDKWGHEAGSDGVCALCGEVGPFDFACEGAACEPGSIAGVGLRPIGDVMRAIMVRCGVKIEGGNDAAK